MTKWTANVDEDDLVIERVTDGHVVIEIPSGKPLRADRKGVEDIRLKLGAALGDNPASESTP